MIPWVDRRGIVWPHDDPQSPVGFLPGFFDHDDPRSAREQIDENYGFGGGWQPIKGFTMEPDEDGFGPVLLYPGDPPLRWLATSKLRDEMLLLFQASILIILQKDGTFEAARVD